MVTRFRNHQTKKGDTMGFVTLEDLQGNIELVVFPKAWEKYHTLVQPDAVLIAEGKVDQEGADPKVLVDKLSEVPLEEQNLAGDEPLFLTSNGFPLDEEEPPAPVEEEPYPVPAAPGETRRVAEPSPASAPYSPADDLTPPEDPPDWEQHIPGWSAPEDVSPPPQREPAPALDQKMAPEPSAPSRAAAALQGLEQRVMGQPPPPILAPAILPVVDPESDEPRMVVVVLHATGDRERDVRRLKMVYGRLRSFPGRDRFAFLICEGSRRYQLEFPNDSTGISPLLLQKLAELVGEENVRITPLRIH